MTKRFLRALVGLILLSTLIFTIIPNILVWVVTGRNYLGDITEWVATGECD